MRAIIGRQKERAMLDECYHSSKSEFLAILGRRRVGKTFLIKEFFDNNFFFYVSGAENATKKMQLKNFGKALKKHSKYPYPAVGDWQDAFEQLQHFIENSKSKERKVLFFDELPWFDTMKSGFLSAFEYFWNTFASSRGDILLIICGSATSWITNKIIKNRGGLHNRVTAQMYLNPFTLKETEEFLEYKNIKFSRYQIAECYMIMGGIPYYLEQLKKGKSLSQNIDNLFFSKDSILKGEFKKLFASLFKKYTKHITIVEILGKKRMGMSREEIVAQSKILDGGGLTSVLEDLEMCGFINVYNAYGKKNKNKVYQLVDFYSLFYLTFIAGSSQTNPQYWTNLGESSTKLSWYGYSFELLCLTHVEQIRQKLGISGVVHYVNSWRSDDKTRQIDLLIDRNDNVINVCEIKFSKDEYTITKEYDRELQAKLSKFQSATATKKALHLTMLTTFGTSKNQYFGNVQNEVNLDDLFS
ncbi:MAG: ATP-binding protein [Bacteroidetes bacterium]|nr:ATP-binding protein [Bacteroidota bacterium]MCL2328146.1 ATP-binding protein [Bacteroidota bacterium]